jgi:hypothetical protein
MLIAYNNDLDRKAKIVASMVEHRRLDRLQQGATGGGNKGCTVACAFQSVQGSWAQCYNHDGLADHLGVGGWLPRLADRIFEGLPKEEAAEFSEAWLTAIGVGDDTSAVRDQLLGFLRAETYAAMGRVVVYADLQEAKLAQDNPCRTQILACYASAR